jgi:hypothetical protein
MAHFIYDSSKKEKGLVIPYDKQDASGYFVTHFRNYLILKFMWETETDFSDRYQARTEMETAEKKMEHWKKHRNWDFSVVEPQIRKLNQQWSQMKPNIKFTKEDTNKKKEDPPQKKK